MDLSNRMAIKLNGYDNIVVASINDSQSKQDIDNINYLNSAICSNGMYIVVGQSGTILTSIDAITWTNRTSNVVEVLFDIAYGNGVFVVVGENGVILTSNNGDMRSKRDSSTTKPLFDIAFNHNIFLIVGSEDLIIKSDNGIRWISDEKILEGAGDFSNLK